MYNSNTLPDTPTKKRKIDTDNTTGKSMYILNTLTPAALSIYFGSGELCGKCSKLIKIENSAQLSI